jgi:hypothetical protein
MAHSAVASDHLQAVDVVLEHDVQVGADDVLVLAGLVVRLPVDGPVGGVLRVGGHEPGQLVGGRLVQGADLDRAVDAGLADDDLSNPLSHAFYALQADHGGLVTVNVSVDYADNVPEVVLLFSLSCLLRFSQEYPSLTIANRISPSRSTPRDEGHGLQFPSPDRATGPGTSPSHEGLPQQHRFCRTCQA